MPAATQELTPWPAPADLPCTLANASGHAQVLPPWHDHYPPFSNVVASANFHAQVVVAPP